ncbi:MAG: glycosyltransferase, partial [Gammaproteobacteria bacterium]
DFPKSNLTYNLADRILVHANEMKQKLVDYGVYPDIIDIVEHGVDIQPLPRGQRQGIIFYGGHFLEKGKGLDTLFQAMAKIKEKQGTNTPTLTIHGHYGESTPAYGIEMMKKYGLVGVVRWLNQLPHDDAVEEYRKALICVLPYTGSFAGLPASTAMANGVPVIATRRAGLPEHLGDAAVWIEENDADGLATSILELLDDAAARERLAQAGRSRAEQFLTWDVIAEKTLASYHAALDHKQAK